MISSALVPALDFHIFYEFRVSLHFHFCKKAALNTYNIAINIILESEHAYYVSHIFEEKIAIGRRRQRAIGRVPRILSVAIVHFCSVLCL